MSARTPVPSVGISTIVPLSLEDWEAKASLTEAEIRSVVVVQKACEEKPLPLKTTLNTPESSSQVYIGDTLASSRPRTPVSGNSLDPRNLNSLLPDRPIRTSQEFHDWFSVIERLVAHSQEAHYRKHLADVTLHLDVCDGLARSIDSIQLEVESMLEGWRNVEAGGKNLKGASEQLLNERDSLIKLAGEIDSRLEYFQELERATRMLNHPGESLVLQADFLTMVERVDICISFFHTHGNYREADVYLLRFQQCLTRAMTLVKMYFTGSLKALSVDVLKRMAGDISQIAQMHLLYTRFQSVAGQIAPLLSELERQTGSHPQELSSILSECHAAYFSTRRTLLVAHLVEEIKGLDPTGSDLLELTKSGCSYLKQLCIDEFSLYRRFFDSGKEGLYAYLESLCDYLYDDLRPRILHEPRLSVLCDVCRILQALMVLDVHGDHNDDDDDKDSSSGQPSSGLRRLHISHMLQSVLQDAQTRLFFKAQSIIQAEIRRFAPTQQDLCYPEKLEEEQQKTQKLIKLKEKEDAFTLFQISSFQRHQSMYTTLRTLLIVLAQLHDFVQPSIFIDIAQEAIDFCRLSLLTAGNMISARHIPSAELNAQLFLIRHLLVLKEISAGLNLQSRELDGPRELRDITDSLKDMLRSTRLIPYPFVTRSKPHYETVNAGTRESIDYDLRRACEATIQLVAGALTQPIISFITGSSSKKSILDSKTLQTASENQEQHEEKAVTVTRSIALEVEKSFLSTLKVELPIVFQRIKLYLADGKESKPNPDRFSEVEAISTERSTVNILMGHIQDRVVDMYVDFRKAAEFIPAKGDERAFATSPNGVRALFGTLVLCPGVL